MAEPPTWSTPGAVPGWDPAGGVPAGWGSPPPGPGWGPPADAPPYVERRPGIVPLRPLSVGEILDGGFAVVRRYPGVAFAWSALVLGVAQAITIGIGLLDGSLATLSAGLPSAGAGATAAGLLRSGVAGAVSATAIAVLTGILSVVVGEAVLGRGTTFGAVWQRVRPRFLPLLVAAAVAGVLPYVGLAFLVVPGVFLWAALAFSTPALVLERLGVVDALGRSRRLVRGDFWRVWSIRALATAIGGVVASLITIPVTAGTGVALFRSLQSGGGTISGGYLVALSVASLVAAILTQPFVAATVALLYVDRRMRAEALDVALVEAAADPGPSTGPAAAGP